MLSLGTDLGLGQPMEHMVRACRGLSGDAISSAGRILAAADSYHALTEARPHRPPRSAADAAAELRAGISSGRLDAAAVDAVLRAAGHRVRRWREWPAGLTAPEVEIVRLLVRGLTAAHVRRNPRGLVFGAGGSRSTFATPVRPIPLPAGNR